MKRYIKSALAPAAALLISLASTSCLNDLDKEPISPKIDLNVNNDGLLNKCYANFGINGNGSGSNSDDDPDVKGFNDPGMTGLVRAMFNMNELPTDEATCSWGDGLQELNSAKFDPSHAWVKLYYTRLTLGITFCNQYLEVAGGEDKQKTAECRFLRAMQYYLLMDAYGNVGFSTTLEKPHRMERAELYKWLVEELNAIEPDLAEPRVKTGSDADYGRVDKAACWLLLSRLYLNAEVYSGKAEWQKAKDYAKKVMESPYDINTTPVGRWSAYQLVFMGDNDRSAASKEILFPIVNISGKTASYGNSLFLIAACFDPTMHANPDDPSGSNGLVGQQWIGLHPRTALLKKFFPSSVAPQVPSYEMTSQAGDDRATFWGQDRTYEIENITKSAEGYGVCKFLNYNSDNSTNTDPAFADMDWPFMRAAEAYLNYAEADARLNGGKTSQEGTRILNKLRDRAHASTRAESSNYSLNEICDEWAREFYFEGMRRTTLVRFGLFGGNTGYNWDWKGGESAGKDFEAYKNIYPIPLTQLQSNTNLKQNPGYTN